MSTFSTLGIHKNYIKSIKELGISTPTEIQEKTIKYLSKQIKNIELEMKQIILENEQLNQQYKLTKSVKGIGDQTALFMIVTTNGFTKFNSWRKYASYCGIAPFSNTSGTSIRGKTKISNLANKKLKSLFDLCAKSAIQNNPEMKKYYHFLQILYNSTPCLHKLEL